MRGISRLSRRTAAVCTAVVVVAGGAVTAAVLHASSNDPVPSAQRPGSSAPHAASSGATGSSTATPPADSSSATATNSAARTATLCSLQAPKVAALVRDHTSAKELDFEAMRDAVDVLDEQLDGLSVVLPSSPAATQFTHHLNSVQTSWQGALLAYDKGYKKLARSRAADADSSIALLTGDLAALKATCKG